MRKILLILSMFFVLFVLSGCQISSNVQKSSQSSFCNSASEQASKEHNPLIWYSAGAFLPGVSIAGAYLWQREPRDTTMVKLGYYNYKYNSFLFNNDSCKQYYNCYKEQKKEEQVEDTVYGSIIGIIMLIWWGLIIF